MEDIKGKVQCFLMAEKIKQIKAKQRYYEIRAFIEEEKQYNPYHDPKNGQFTSGKGGGGVNGVVLAVAKGQKGKGYYTDTKGDKNWTVLAKADATQEQIDQLLNGKNVASQATNSNQGLTGKSKSSTIEDGKHGDFSVHVEQLKKTKIEYKEVVDLKQPLSEEAIIDKLGGGDQTKGSCASLAFAYAANKAGYDVTDYRGGESQDWFATDNRSRIKQLPDSNNVKFGKDATPGKIMKFMSNNINEGDEYVVSAGKHCAIVKKDSGKLFYLELQQEPGVIYKSGIGKKGWKPMTKTDTFSKRFGYSRFHGYYSGASMVKVSDLPKAVGFKEMVGYLNTSADKQQKGAKGYAK